MPTSLARSLAPALVVATLFAPTAKAAPGPQTLLSIPPVVAVSIHETPGGTFGDYFNPPPLDGLLQWQSLEIDRVIHEYDLSAISGRVIGRATLTGRLEALDSADSGVRQFFFHVYSGDGIAEVSEFQSGTYGVGLVQFHPPSELFTDFSVDVTGRLRTMLDQGATHLGVAVGSTTSPCFDTSLVPTSAVLEVEALDSIGTSYCGPANPNSTGQSAVIEAFGSPLATDNLLVLRASQLTLQTFGFFITSRTQDFLPNPGGSQGNVCVGGAIGRFYGQGQIQISGPHGLILLQLDLTQMPQPTSIVAVQAGETWNYQLWFRELVTGVPTSNLTDAVSISFI